MIGSRKMDFDGETGNGELEALKRRKVRYDPTINLGHVLTIAAFIVTGLGAWSTLDKRLVMLEEQRRAQEQTDRYQDQTMRDNLAMIKDSVTGINKSVEKINDRLDRVVIKP